MNRMSRMLTGPVSLRILSILFILSNESAGRLWFFFEPNHGPRRYTG
jgi:hypothetical protein